MNPLASTAMLLMIIGSALGVLHNPGITVLFCLPCANLSKCQVPNLSEFVCLLRNASNLEKRQIWLTSDEKWRTKGRRKRTRMRLTKLFSYFGSLGFRLIRYFPSYGSCPPSLFNRDSFGIRHEKSRIGRLKNSVMVGCNFSDVSVTELDRCLGSSYLHHLPDSPSMCSGMVHKGTSFNSQVLSLNAKGYAIKTMAERYSSMFDFKQHVVCNI